MSRRNALIAEIRLAISRAGAGPDPHGLGFLAPEAFEELLALTREVHDLAVDLTTAKFHWHWHNMARGLDGIILRLRRAPDGAAAVQALNELSIMLTDGDRWR